jgi:hypothetical protein
MRDKDQMNKSDSTMPDSVICLSPFPWAGCWQTTHSVAQSLARHTPVLFVGQAPLWNPSDPNFSYREVLRGLGGSLSKSESGVYTLTPRTVPLGRFDRIRRLNEAWYVAAIEAARRELGFRHLCIGFHISSDVFLFLRI